VGSNLRVTPSPLSNKEHPADYTADLRVPGVAAVAPVVSSLEKGDTAEVLFARGTKNQRLRMMNVAGVFERFPGFPEKLQIVANLGYYQAETGLKEVDFFLARTTDQSNAGLGGAVSALRAGPARQDRLAIDTTETTFNKDQSSLTALNIRGLLDLDSL
jgi:putative ABC transport system permease protein